jgi:hypothetical protein
MEGTMNSDRIAAIRAEANAANINETTLLATDYLNHFNEAMMLLELVPSMPECIEDLADWRPIDYAEHFHNSNSSGRDLAIEAYFLSPEEYRHPFDAMIDRLGILLASTIRGARALISMGKSDAAAAMIETAMPAIRCCQETAGAIINGPVVKVDDDHIIEDDQAEINTLDQSAIDELLNS